MDDSTIRKNGDAALAARKKFRGNCHALKPSKSDSRAGLDAFHEARPGIIPHAYGKIVREELRIAGADWYAQETYEVPLRTQFGSRANVISI